MIGVLASGEGTNLQALLDARLPVAAVASNVAGARALERAERAGVAAAAFPLGDFESRAVRDEAMADWLVEHGVRLVVCAGYMHLLRPRFFEVFGRRVVNTHSAPLPAFPGAQSVPVTSRSRSTTSALGLTMVMPLSRFSRSLASCVAPSRLLSVE